MPSLNREKYIDPESADESSGRSRGHQTREFARKEDTFRALRIEERVRKAEHAVEVRDRGLDETLIDTFPCSDALSSIPHPAVECRLGA
jgi:hypothetical protein